VWVNLKVISGGRKIFLEYLFPNILKYKSCIKIQWLFVILLSLYVIRNLRGTCSSVEILKVYMVRERLGTSGLEQFNFV